VFPTRVGVNRPSTKQQSCLSSVPHARGGEPLLVMTVVQAPRVPHARGGEPKGGYLPLTVEMCSPRAWG